MRRGLVIVAAVVVLLSPARTAAAPAAAPPGCTGPVSNPSAGHYTGTWHSDGDYHFTAAFPTGTIDVELKVTIDGTLDLTVGSGGQVTGTAQGTVDAPVYRDGVHDISSGTGTISGPLSGTLNDLTLASPTIVMEWGTFEGTVERDITMPNYQLGGGSADCVSGSGTIAEQGFPVQNLVADGTGQATQAPGIGSADGTWEAVSDEKPVFDQLSQQIDAFIASANTVIQSADLTAEAVETQVVQPLSTVESAIAAHPDLAPCLQAKIDAWEAAERPLLNNAIHAVLSASGSLDGIRQAGDLLAATSQIPDECSVGDGGNPAALQSAALGILTSAIRSGDWATAALSAREMTLQGVPAATEQMSIDQGLHSRLSNSAGSATRDTGRVAYAFGDIADARAVAAQIPTNKPKKLGPRLLSGIAHVSLTTPSGTQPTFGWVPVTGAVSYIAAVWDKQGLAWSWSGTQTSVRYGDTMLDGTSDIRPWPVTITFPYSLSVLALNAQGQIIAARLHVPIHS